MGSATPASIRSAAGDTIHVRPFRQSDRTTCVTLLASLDRGDRAAERIEWWLDQRISEMPSIVVATRDTEPVGFLTLRFTELSSGHESVPIVTLDGCVIDVERDSDIIREELRETGIEYAARSGRVFAVDTMPAVPESEIERSSWTPIGLQEQHVRIQSVSRYLPNWLGSRTDPPLRRLQALVTNGRQQRHAYSRSLRRRAIDVVTAPGIRETAVPESEESIRPQLSPSYREWLSAAPTIEWTTAVAYEFGDPVAELLIGVEKRSSGRVATILPTRGLPNQRNTDQVWHALVGVALGEVSTVDRVRAPGGRQFSPILRQWGFLSLERFPFSIVTDPRLIRIRQLEPSMAWDELGMDLRSPTNWRDGSYNPFGDIATITRSG